MAVNLVGNINGKIYHAPTINLFEKANTQKNELKSIKDTALSGNVPEVKLSISKDGFRALHGTKLAGSQDITELQTQKENIINHQPIESFSNYFAKSMPSNYEQDENGEYVFVKHSVEEKAESLLNAYKSMYDEIVSGHDTGTRIRFVEDESAKDGYRQISKEEELSILQNEFTDFVEKRFGTERQKLSPVNNLSVFNDFQIRLSGMQEQSESNSFDHYVNKMATVYHEMRDSIEEKYADSQKEQMYYVAEDGTVQKLTKEKELEMLNKAYEQQSKLMATSSDIWAGLGGFQPVVKEDVYQAFMSAKSMDNRNLLLREQADRTPVKLHLNITNAERQQLNKIWDFYLEQK